MEIFIKDGESILAGKYELTGREKLENAKGNLSNGYTDRQLLIEYDRIAGRLLRDGQLLPPQSIWQVEKAREQRPIEEFSDEELQTIIRRAENTNISGSLYQKANNEWKLRHDQKMFDATKRKKWSSDNVPVGYPASCASDQIREVLQDLSDEKTRELHRGKNNPFWEKIINGHIESGQRELSLRREIRKWYEKPLGLIGVGIIIGLAVAYLTHLLGWT